MSESGKDRVGELGREEGNENGEGEGLRMERERGCQVKVGSARE